MIMLIIITLMAIMIVTKITIMIILIVIVIIIIIIIIIIITTIIKFMTKIIFYSLRFSQPAFYNYEKIKWSSWKTIKSFLGSFKIGASVNEILF